MKFSKRLLAGGAGLALALSVAACNTTPGGTAGGDGGDTIKVGVKFDQPGLGLKEATGNTGFDVEVAKYVAGELGYEESDIEFIETPSAQRETMIQGGQVDMIVATYSITDARKERVSFAGPYFVAGQDLLVKTDSDITGPDALDGRRLCSVTGSTPAQNVKDKFANEVQLQEYDTYSKCVEALSSGAVDAVTTDDVILAGFAAQPQYQGQLKVIGQPFSTENYGIGITKGDVERCEQINTAIQKMIDDGSWQAALDKTVGPSGFTPDPATNPPKPGPCS